MTTTPYNEHIGYNAHIPYNGVIVLEREPVSQTTQDWDPLVFEKPKRRRWRLREIAPVTGTLEITVPPPHLRLFGRYAQPPVTGSLAVAAPTPRLRVRAEYSDDALITEAIAIIESIELDNS